MCHQEYLRQSFTNLMVFLLLQEVHELEREGISEITFVGWMLLQILSLIVIGIIYVFLLKSYSTEYIFELLHKLEGSLYR